MIPESMNGVENGLIHFLDFEKNTKNLLKFMTKLPAPLRTPSC